MFHILIKFLFEILINSGLGMFLRISTKKKRTNWTENKNKSKLKRRADESSSTASSRGKSHFDHAFIIGFETLRFRALTLALIRVIYLWVSRKIALYKEQGKKMDKKVSEEKEEK
jgi:hypothetical protein